MRHARVTLAPLGFVAFFAACTAARAPSDPPKTAATSGEGTSAMLASSVERDESAMGRGSMPSSATRETTERGANAVATASTANPAAATPAFPADVTVTDEPIYFPGARPRAKGTAVEVSLDEETVATWNRGGLGTDADVGPKGKPPHAAPRVKVDVTEVRGSASEAEMQRAARLKSYWPFRICYEQGLRRTQKLHGTIKLRLTIGSSGRPSNVQPIATELGDPEVVSCVVKSAAALALPAPSGGAPQVTLEIQLWPGDAPVSVKGPLRGKNAVPAEAASFAEALRARTNDVRKCYAEGIRRHEKLWGRLALSLKIANG
ncbi:MAG: AgmX/PglI C-terminal domain-containing protein, partial [Polyangiaceae bacterium]